MDGKKTPILKRDAGSLELIGGRLCLDFVNTTTARGLDRHREYLTSFRALLAWGAHAGALGIEQKQALARCAERKPQAAREALIFAVDLRESLYRVLRSAISGGQVPESDLALLNIGIQAAGARLVLRQASDRMSRVWEFDPQDLRMVLWPVMHSAAKLLTSPDLGRVRQCAREGCQWMFFDTSKNRSRRWCMMAVCGSRMKARRFYERVRKDGRAARG